MKYFEFIVWNDFWAGTRCINESFDERCLCGNEQQVASYYANLGVVPQKCFNFYLIIICGGTKLNKMSTAGISSRAYNECISNESSRHAWKHFNQIFWVDLRNPRPPPFVVRHPVSSHTASFLVFPKSSAFQGCSCSRDHKALRLQLLLPCLFRWDVRWTCHLALGSIR